MATGVLVGYPSSAVRDSGSGVLEQGKELRMRHSKSEPLLLLLSSRKSLTQCLDQDRKYFEASARSLAQQRIMRQKADTLSLENIRSHYNSCYTCGVSWREEHISLDCSECGGYAMHRPCARCNGHCEGVWDRDLAASHKQRLAQWLGDCNETPPRATADKRQDS